MYFHFILQGSTGRGGLPYVLFSVMTSDQNLLEKGRFGATRGKYQHLGSKIPKIE